MQPTKWFLVMEMSDGRVSVISLSYNSFEEVKKAYDTWPQNEGILICQTVYG